MMIIVEMSLMHIRVKGMRMVMAIVARDGAVVMKMKIWGRKTA